MTFFTSIVLILFYQIIIVHGQPGGSQSIDDDDLSGVARLFSSFNNNNDIPEYIANALNVNFPGRTLQYADLLSMINDSRIYDDQCEFQLKSDVDNFMGDKLIIGQLSNINQIKYVQISFHDENGDPVRDDDGNPIIYTSIRQELGHVLDILHQGFAFSYAKCLLKLQPNSNFDLHSLFFHFPQPLLTSTPKYNISGIINGSNSFTIDSLQQMYNVSLNCSFGLTCMWLLDDEVISLSPNSSILLTFEPKNIGNRTLSYVAYIGNNRQTLASLLLSILPSTRRVCNTLSRSTRNVWLRAGTMSSPRVYFTVTYLTVSGYVMIAGGTADFSTPLLSVDIYDPVSGCYNVSNMTYPRMKHTAAYYNNSDVVILIGGVREGRNITPVSEFISINGTQLHVQMNQARFFHEIATLNNSNILIVAGQGFNDTTRQLEMYNRNSVIFQQLESYESRLVNLEGHSVTNLGESGTALIFGGYNGVTYFRIRLIADGTNLTATDNTGRMISKRAHHQATYIPGINAVLITGGDNGTNTFDTCYLYYFGDKTYNATGSMLQRRSFHAAVLLTDGSVLIIGGAAAIRNNQPIDVLNSVERYDTTTQSFTSVVPLNIARYRHKAVVLPGGNEVFVFGGIDANNNTLSSFEYINLELVSNHGT